MATTETTKELPKIPADVKTKAIADHGEDALQVVETKRGEVLVRAPKRGEWKRFKAAAINEKQRADATENLVRSCVVHPAEAEFSKLLERFPALADSLGEIVVDLAGAEDALVGKGL